MGLMDICAEPSAMSRAEWRMEQCREVGTAGAQGLAAALKSRILSNKAVVTSLDGN